MVGPSDDLVQVAEQTQGHGGSWLLDQTVRKGAELSLVAVFKQSRDISCLVVQNCVVLQPVRTEMSRGGWEQKQCCFK